MKRYGLIGYPLTHSFSQRYFSEKFLNEHIADSMYENFPISAIGELRQLLLSHPDLCGLNVTIPYKKEVLSFLDESSPAVESMGACNCVKIKDGILMGYNTDVIGFKQSLQPFLKPEHTAALILGTGGAASAVAYVLNELSIPFQSVSRNKSIGTITYEEIDANLMYSHTLIINTTPLGMFPSVDTCPPLPYSSMSAAHHCFDLIYNPSETLFMRKAAAAGASVQNGANMLVIQAEESWRIWNDL